ncbi:hypothetical protein MOKP64_50770 [Mycobacterium avium subsp. hominissuis]
MTVGEYAGVPLQDAGDSWRNGGVFLLRKPARASASETVHGWTTTVVAGQTAVITCGPSAATTFDATFSDALTAANQGLDYISVTAQADCAIRDAPDDSLIWWPDASRGGVVMRYQMVMPLPLLTPRLVGVVTDPQGNVVPPPPEPSPLVDDAFRFVRMARTSDDLFDAYRNMFLAFESLLSDIRPRQRQQPQPLPWWKRCLKTSPSAGQRPWETEHKWFMDALDQAHKLVPLGTLTPTNVTNHKKWIERHIYSAERSALMHAKRGQNYLLPHGAADRAELIESLGRLSDYIKSLIEKYLHVRAPSGFFSPYAIAQGAQAVLPKLIPVVSDDEGPVIQGVENLINPGATVVQLSLSTPRVDPDDPVLWWVDAHCDAADVAALSAIRRVGHTRPEGDSEAVSELVGPLILGGTVVRLEMIRGLRYVNPTGPPRQFSS